MTQHDPSPERPFDRASVPPNPAAPPSAGDVAWQATITTVKAATVALAVDAFVNSNSPRFRGKGMRLRAIGYTASLFVVPIVWRLRGRAGRYPRELDLAIAVPMLVDAAGNAVGIYQGGHVDDAVHFANGAVFSAVVGAVAAPRLRTAWEAAGLATLAGIAAAAVWEIGEWMGMKLGAKGMNLTYDDTMEDIIETSAGALLGGLLTLLRDPTRLRQVPGRASDPIVATARQL